MGKNREGKIAKITKKFSWNRKKKTQTKQETIKANSSKISSEKSQ